MNKVVKTLKESKSARWIALACLVVPMFASYFFDDMFSSVSHVFENPALLELGWDSGKYGIYASGYSLLCVWGGLIVCGILLDKWGVRVTGSIFVGLMVLGATFVLFTITNQKLVATGNSHIIANIGYMLFGLGSEIAGVAVTRSIAKWFKGKNTALAMSLQLAIARLGTALALFISPKLIGSAIAEASIQNPVSLSVTSRPALAGVVLLFAGMIVWAIFVAMDAKFDKQEGTTDKVETSEEDKFKFSDVWKILTNKHFLQISLLCVFFYCCIISFKKFGTAILIPRFGMDPDSASTALAALPFFTILFTPIFGILVDKIGKATTWMITGSVLVFTAHIIIAFAPSSPFFGFASIGLLGIGYSLVPAAMWPSVPKLVSDKVLGTAYSLIYWIQNLGMWAVPIIVGFVMKTDANVELSAAEKAAKAVNAEYVFIILGIVAIVVSLLLYASSKKNPQLKLDVPSNKK